MPRRLARPISPLLAATLVACIARVSPVAARDTGKARELRETIDATTLEVAIAPGRLGLGDAGVVHALDTSLRALGAY